MERSLSLVTGPGLSLHHLLGDRQFQQQEQRLIQQEAIRETVRHIKGEGRFFWGSDGSPKERMVLIRQYKAQVLQLMLIRPSQPAGSCELASWKTSLMVVFLWKVEERGEFQTSVQDAKAAKVISLLWVSPN